MWPVSWSQYAKHCRHHFIQNQHSTRILPDLFRWLQFDEMQHEMDINGCNVWINCWKLSFMQSLLMAYINPWYTHPSPKCTLYIITIQTHVTYMIHVHMHVFGHSNWQYLVLSINCLVIFSHHIWHLAEIKSKLCIKISMIHSKFTTVRA